MLRCPMKISYYVVSCCNYVNRKVDISNRKMMQIIQYCAKVVFSDARQS